MIVGNNPFCEAKGGHPLCLLYLREGDALGITEPGPDTTSGGYLSMKHINRPFLGRYLLHLGPSKMSLVLGPFRVRHSTWYLWTHGRVQMPEDSTHGSTTVGVFEGKLVSGLNGKPKGPPIAGPPTLDIVSCHYFDV